MYTIEIGIGVGLLYFGHVRLFMLLSLIVILYGGVRSGVGVGSGPVMREPRSVNYTRSGISTTDAAYGRQRMRGHSTRCRIGYI
jgi:hypothetical protein